jgi:hypothetical protein
MLAFIIKKQLKAEATDLGANISHQYFTSIFHINISNQ